MCMRSAQHNDNTEHHENQNSIKISTVYKGKEIQCERWFIHLLQYIHWLNTDSLHKDKNTEHHLSRSDSIPLY